MHTKRDPGLDLIRASAMTAVFAVHFFLNSGFYEVQSGGWAMTLGVLVRTQLMVCVPLFLILTGWLQKDRIWSWDYYKGIGSLLATYVLASILCAVFRALFLDGVWSPVAWMRDLLAFRLAPYGWYIELYLGLFLLIPFLNAAWRGLKNKRARQCLVITVVFLSIGPSLNVISMHFGWKTVLSGWDNLYPVAYYFLGCYLRDYPPRWSRKGLLLMDAAAVLAGGLLHAYQAIGEPFGFFALTYWNGFFTFLAVVSVFQLLRSCPFERAPRRVRRTVSLMASLSLPAFLVSWVPDQIAYGLLKRLVPTMVQRFPWGLVTVPFVLAGSILLSLGLKGVQRGLRRILSWGRKVTPSP